MKPRSTETINYICIAHTGMSIQDYIDRKQCIVFEDYPEFKPFFTPTEMLCLGIFGGIYFSQKISRAGIDAMNLKKPIYSGVGNNLQQHIDEMPEIFTPAAISMQIPEGGRAHKNLALFNSIASMTLKWWLERNMIHEQDPLGWVQWYFRFYRGRRTLDDRRQINRWLNFDRQSARICNLVTSGIYKPGDLTQSPRQRQALLHWSYNPFL